jgi:hypothetical protein
LFGWKIFGASTTKTTSIGKTGAPLASGAPADFFNVFNHPNFDTPVNYVTSSLFGQAAQMLEASLGSGGQERRQTRTC